MANSEGVVKNGFVLRMSVPASGELASVGAEMAVKLAEQIGVGSGRVASVAAAITDLALEVSPGGSEDVSFEFHKSDTELTIEARQNGRASATRITLTA